jgi:Holliday junction DNA helicase RuvA
MIAMLTGEVVVVDLNHNYIFLRTSRNISYEVHLTRSLIERLADVKNNIEEIQLYTFTVYKENDATLYGFETLQERRMFEKLLSVKGVGPSTTLTILSDMEYEELAEALVAENIEKFTAVKGIGEATAKNIIAKLGNFEK